MKHILELFQTHEVLLSFKLRNVGSFLGVKLTLSAISVALLLSLYFASCCCAATPSGHFVQLRWIKSFTCSRERRSSCSGGGLLVDDLNKTTCDQCYSSRL